MPSFLLEIVEGEGAGRQFPLQETLELGREQASAGVLLEDTQVSRRHARVTLAGGGPVIEDLGSSNGTFVNGEPIHGPRVLAPGDRIRCGLTVLQVRSTEQVAARPSAAVATPTVTSLVPTSAPAPPPPPPLRVEQRPPAYMPEQAVGMPRAEQNYEAIEQLVDSRVKQRARVAGIAAMSISALIVLLYFGLR